MNWGTDILMPLGGAIVFGAMATAAGFLGKKVWENAPPRGTRLQRLWAGARRAPWAAASGGGLMVLGIVALVVGGVIAGPPPEPKPEVESTPEPTPSSTPSATPEAAPLPGRGWGPSRDLASHDNRPDTAMLNSVVDDPSFGDERSFMLVRLADDENATWANTVVAVPGNVYEVAVIVNNDAAEGGEAAEDVRLRVEMPNLAFGVDAASEAFVTSSNVTPEKVWAGMTWVAESAGEVYMLRYVSRSAALHTGGEAKGAPIADELFTEGVLLGCDALDGILPAGERCQSWVSFKIKVDRPDFDVAAFAQLDGTDTWGPRFVAAPGEQITLAGSYTNTGTVEQDDVTVSVSLPDNMHYMKGSASWSNASTKNQPADDDDIFGNGINVGRYAPGESMWVYFNVLVDEPSSGPGTQEVEDIITVHTSSENKGANLTVLWL